MSLGVVGLGSWGRAAARALAAVPRAEVRWLCDRDPKVPLRSPERYPEARRTTELDDLLDDETLDAVVVATPAPTRAEIVRRALDADKHVLVREPFALDGVDAGDLVALAERRGRRLAPAGGLVRHPAVRALARLLEQGGLGEAYYLTLMRQQPSSAGVDVLWDLGAADVSLVLALLRDTPVESLSAGESYVEPGVRDLIACHLHFATGISAQLHLSRLGHRTVHELVAVGSRATAVFDGLGDGALSVAEAREHRSSDGSEIGVVVTPRFAPASPLRLDCEAFVGAVRSTDDSLTDARRAAATVNVLQALDAAPGAEHRTADDAEGGELLRLPTLPAGAAASAEDGSR